MAEAQRNPRPKPTVTRLTEPFWQAAREKKLLLQYDPEAGKYQFWPRPVSVYTGKANLEWREVPGTGKLHSYTVSHVPARGFEDLAPYPIGAVELDEGVRVMARLVNLDPDEIEIGMRLRVCWEEIGDGVTIFCFEPDR